MDKLNQYIEELRSLKLTIHELRKIFDKIQDENIKKLLKNIIVVSDKIYKEVAINTEKLRKIRNFSNYYIITVLKILNQYNKFVDAKLNTKEAKELYIKVEEFLPRVNKSFEKIYESLFNDEIIDLDSEIKVLLKEIKF